MKGLLVLAMMLALPSWLNDWWRDTNSHAANARGVRAWAKNEYAAAAAAFARAGESAEAAFNLGTAELAAGDVQQGAADLEAAVNDPRLRADALFNRGNGALAAKDFDRAVADYADALRSSPSHAAAKRNLEIALRRRAAERAASGQRRNEQGQQQGEQQQPSPDDGQQQAGAMDLEALLRSVQQQEQEELRRMKGSAGEGRVGW